MSRNLSTRGRQTALALAVAPALFVFGLNFQARAADDGEAPIWTGLGSVVGLTKSDSDGKSIEYREHGKLVVPPKMDLPKPGVGHTAASWPTDQEVQRAKKFKELEDGPSTLPSGRKTTPIVQAGATVTMSPTAGVGPSGAGCLNNGQLVPCPDAGSKPKSQGESPSIYWNPLTWVGLQKKPDTVLGPEPERDSLTDPPTGYRAPVEGVGAKVQNN
jgi:hypothetical protein